MLLTQGHGVKKPASSRRPSVDTTSQNEESDNLMRLDKRYLALQMVVREKDKDLQAYNQAVTEQEIEIEKLKKRIFKLTDNKAQICDLNTQIN